MAINPCRICGATERNTIGQCLPCKRAASKRFYESHPDRRVRGDPDKNRARMSAWRKAHPRYAQRQRLRQEYGLSLEDYDAMVLASGGRCACCGEPFGAPGPQIDHDHDYPGTHRELLCFSCNAMLGNARDSVKRLLLGVDYIRRHTVQ